MTQAELCLVSYASSAPEFYRAGAPVEGGNMTKVAMYAAAFKILALLRTSMMVVLCRLRDCAVASTASSEEFSD